MQRFAWFRFSLLIFSAFIIILIFSWKFIGFLVFGGFSKINIRSIIQTLRGNSNQLNVISVDRTQMISATNQLSLYDDYVLSLERRNSCNLEKPAKCFGTEKSLVITFWSQKSNQRWLATNLLSIFPEKYYDYVVMVHDNSSWNHHSAYDKIIWIHVKNQYRFWYIKRFLTPHTIRAYRYVWVIDDDARLSFNPRVYECIADKYNIPLSAPGRGDGVKMYEITKVVPNYTSRIGRWTDFVEIGPVFVATSSVWACLWNYLSEKVGLGYGLDEIWCRILSEHCSPYNSIFKVCAILDVFVLHHDSTTINTIEIGTAEVPAYRKYHNYSSKRVSFGPIATDLTALDLCTTNFTADQN